MTGRLYYCCRCGAADTVGRPLVSFLDGWSCGPCYGVVLDVLLGMLHGTKPEPEPHRGKSRKVCDSIASPDPPPLWDALARLQEREAELARRREIERRSGV